MKCERCGNIVKEQNCREFQEKIICEDCYMEDLSPVKTCDPWAVYSAKSSLEKEGPKANITKMQSRILQILEETGGVEPEILSERLQLDSSDLEREIATLRHMEKARAQIRKGKKIICIW
jgi:hypothetical protein